MKKIVRIKLPLDMHVFVCERLLDGQMHSIIHLHFNGSNNNNNKKKNKMFLLIENMARSMHFISIRLCLLLDACVWSAVCKMLVYTTVMIVNVLFVFCTGRNAIMHFKWHTNGKFIGEDFTKLHQYRAREREREKDRLPQPTCNQNSIRNRVQQF